MSHPDYRGPGDRTGVFGPALVNVLLQTLETGFIIAQLITFCDKVGRFPRWISGIVLFTTLASLCVACHGLTFNVNRGQSLTMVSSLQPSDRHDFPFGLGACYSLRWVPGQGQGIFSRNIMRRLLMLNKGPYTFHAGIG